MSKLTPTERLALSVGHIINRPRLFKRIQIAFIRQIHWRIVHYAIGHRVYLDQVHHATFNKPDRGVILAANHRSFFDLHAIMTAFMNKEICSWLQGIYFPVRSDFFYTRLLGIVVNILSCGGAMYPPIFRNPKKRGHTENSIETIIDILKQPGVVMGINPEGTRNKSDDPYTLLPFKPGIGRFMHTASPMVIPIFSNGLTNRFSDLFRHSKHPNSRQNHPIIVVFGKPIDYSEYLTETPRVTLYKKIANHVRDEITVCGERERYLRNEITKGNLLDSSAWLNSID